MANAPVYLNHSGQAEDAQGVIVVQEDGTFLDWTTIGGGGGGGDASAANQTSQITQETATAAALGTTAGAAVITDANGTIQQYLRGLVKRWVDALGAGTAAAALRVTLSSDGPFSTLTGAVTETAPASDTASSGVNGRLQRIAQRLTTLDGKLDTVITNTDRSADASESTVPVTVQTNSEYETVAASQTAQTIGPTGATGDYLSHLIVTPASVSPGVVTILDNAISINLFAGGTNSLLTLHPFTVYVGMTSVSGAWKVTTGASVSVVAVGNFT